MKKIIKIFTTLLMVALSLMILVSCSEKTTQSKLEKFWESPDLMVTENLEIVTTYEKAIELFGEPTYYSVSETDYSGHMLVYVENEQEYINWHADKDQKMFFSAFSGVSYSKYSELGINKLELTFDECRALMPTEVDKRVFLNTSRVYRFSIRPDGSGIGANRFEEV